MFFTDTLKEMQGRVQRQRPGISPDLVRDFLNDRLRTIGERKPNWAGMFQRGVISIPDQYATGAITLTNGSSTVAGIATAWPVSDVVNATIPVSIRPGDSIVTPSSMANITADTVLYVDAGGNPEIVPVVDIGPTQFRATFQYDHNAGFTITASSLAGRQLRIGTSDPIFSINAVTSATSLILDSPWGRTSQTGIAYQILKMYTIIGTDVRDIVGVADPFQQIRLALHVPQGFLNATDPNRQSTDNPQMLADLGPNLCGNMLYELWPPQTTSRHLYVMYYKKWPDLKKPHDRCPPFINPSFIVYGALADAYRTPCPLANGPKGELSDPYLNQQTSMLYEQKFEAGVLDAIQADNGIAQTMVTADWDSWPMGGGMGASWNMAHAVSSDGEYLSP